MVTVEVETRDVLRRDFLKFVDRGVEGKVGALRLQHRRGRLPPRFLVPVGDPFNHPSGLDIAKHRLVVGRPGWGKHPGDAHSQGVDPRDVEHLLRRGDDAVTGLQAESTGHAGSQHTITEPPHRRPPGQGKSTEAEIVETGPDDPEAPGLEPGVDRDHRGAGFPGDLATDSERQDRDRRFVEIQSVEDHLQLTARGAHQQGSGGGAGAQMPFHGLHSHRDGQGQKQTQGQGGDQKDDPSPLPREMAPAQMKNPRQIPVHHEAWSSGSERCRSKPLRSEGS